MSQKSLVIVSSDRLYTGAVALRQAAENYGLNARIAVINEDDIVGLVNASDYAMFRIKPGTYDFYTSIQADIDARYAEKFRGFLAAFDKLQTFEILQKNNIPTPQSYYISRDDTIRSFPAVIKVLHGNQGNGVALLKSLADFDTFMMEYNEDSYLVQEFIEQATGHDKRLLVAGGKLIGAMERRATKDDFRANLHQGGRAEKYAPSEQEIDLAIRTVKAFDLDLAGVDIVDSDHGPLVLEVNASPGLAIGEVIGVDVAKEIIEELFHD